MKLARRALDASSSSQLHRVNGILLVDEDEVACGLVVRSPEGRGSFGSATLVCISLPSQTLSASRSTAPRVLVLQTDECVRLARTLRLVGRRRQQTMHND